MIRRPFLVVTVGCTILAVAPCQEKTSVFQLGIPKFGDHLFGGGEIIEIPGPLPTKLRVRVLNPVAGEVSYGAIRVNLNGQTAMRVVSVRGAAFGKLVELDLGRDMRLVPGTNTLEIGLMAKNDPQLGAHFVIRSEEHARYRDFAYSTKYCDSTLR